MRKRLYFFFLFLCIFIFSLNIKQSYAENCLHESYPGVSVVYENSISKIVLSGRQEVELKNYGKDPINSSKLQNKCHDKFPNPPYLCKINNFESYTLDPEPKLKNMSTQGAFGSCYVTAPFFALEELINTGKKDADRIKFSHSDAICQANREIKLYKRGGFSPSALLNIAESGSLLLCKNEKISHEKVVDNIGKSPGILSDIEKFSMAYQSVQESLKMSDGSFCEKMKLPSFSINGIDLSRKVSIAQLLLNHLKTNKVLIGIDLPEHVTNIYGINTYDCTSNTDKDPVKIITYKIIDPWGEKFEMFSDDIEKGILKGDHAYYLSLENEPLNNNSKTNNTYKGFINLGYAILTGNSEIVKRYLNKDNIDGQLFGEFTPLGLAVNSGYKDIAELLIKNKAGGFTDPGIEGAKKQAEIAIKLKKVEGFDYDDAIDGARNLSAEQVELAIKLKNVGGFNSRDAIKIAKTFSADQVALAIKLKTVEGFNSIYAIKAAKDLSAEQLVLAIKLKKEGEFEVYTAFDGGGKLSAEQVALAIKLKKEEGFDSYSAMYGAEYLSTEQAVLAIKLKKEEGFDSSSAVCGAQNLSTEQLVLAIKLKKEEGFSSSDAIKIAMKNLSAEELALTIQLKKQRDLEIEDFGYISAMVGAKKLSAKQVVLAIKLKKEEGFRPEYAIRGAQKLSAEQVALAIKLKKEGNFEPNDAISVAKKLSAEEVELVIKFKKEEGLYSRDAIERAEKLSTK